MQLAEVDDATFKDIDQALMDHLVLFFRDQELTPAEHVTFAARLGPFEVHPFARPHADFPELTVLDQTTPKTDGANSWHSDSSFMPRPALGSVLRAVRLPPFGSDTCWASMYAAYETLSPRMRQLIDGATAMHDIIKPLEKAIAGGHSISGLDAARAKFPPIAHPIVRTHPVTGRKALYVNNNFTTRICELDEYESRAVLHFLLEHVAKPDFQVRFQWAPGSVVVWDNRVTQHYAVPDYTGHRRIMHRATIQGEQPS